MSAKFAFTQISLYTTVAIAALASPAAFAQNIIPSAETNTLVDQNNNLYTITGGVVTPDNFNGFHKFELFNLDSGEIANFLTQQDLRNLFVGVNGGDPSIINGLIELTGSNANFFFVNPAGIVFGQGAMFNLPADLTVTTANRIGFGENSWFDVLQANDYSTFLGDPTGFAFDALEPSAIINEANINLEKGSVSFYGGGVAHTGSIRAGKVTIQSVNGQTTARILPEGSLIGIEVDIPTEKQGNIPTSNLSELYQNQSANQEIQQSTNLGDVEFSTIISGDVNTSSSSGVGGDIKILGEAVLLSENANINASGELGGGNINIGGSYQGKGDLENSQFTLVDKDVFITTDALTNGNGGKVIIWADNKTAFLGSLNSRGGQVSGDGGFAEISGKDSLIYRGTVDLSANNGEFGTLLFDPVNITIENGSGTNSDSTFFEANLEALDGNTNVVLTATNDITLRDLADNILFFNGGSGTINITADSDGDGIGSFIFDDKQDLIRAPNRDITISAATVDIGRIETVDQTSAGNVTISTTGDLTLSRGIAAFADPTNSDKQAGSTVTLTSGGDLRLIDCVTTTGATGIATGVCIETFGGDINLTSGRDIIITEGYLNAGIAHAGVAPGNIRIEATGDITLTDIDTGIEYSEARGPFFGPPSLEDAGDITIISGGTVSFIANLATNNVGQIFASSANGSGGQIIIDASEDISIPLIRSEAGQNNDSGGSILLTARNGNLTVQDIYSTGFNAGNIELIAAGNISAGTLISNPNFGTAGNIIIDAGNTLTLNGNDDPTRVFNGVISAFSNATSGGIIDLTAGGNINLNCPYNCLRVGADPNNLTLTSSFPGSITLNSGGSINLQNIFTDDTSGFTDSLALFIDASNRLGDGGQISIQAVNDIQVGTMSVSSFGTGSSAGRIEIISTEGSVNTIPLNLGDTVLAGRTLGTNTESAQSNAGSLLIDANGDITTGFIRFWGTQNAGNIELISRNGGTIDTTAGHIEIFSQENANAGSATLSTSGIINLGAVNDIALINPPGDNNIRTIANASGANLTLNSSTTNLFGNIDISGNAPGGALIFQNDVIVHDSVTIAGDNINFSGTLNSLDGTQSFTLTTGGDISFLDALGNTNPFAGLTITGNQADINQNISVNGDLIVNALANIQAASTLSAGTNSINLNGGLTANAGVILEADNLALAGTFTGNGNTLAIRPATQSRDITLGSEVANTLSLSDNEVALLNGFSSVEIGRIDGTGDININAAISPQDPLLLQTTANINANANINGTDDASLTLTAANIVANTNIISTNGQNITVNGNVLLNNDLALDTGTAGGDLTIGGNTTGQFTLSPSTGTGRMTFEGLIDVFDVNFGEAASVSFGGDVTIANSAKNFSIDNPTVLANNINITTGGGDFIVNNTVNSQANTAFNLGINPAGGNVTVNAAMGSTQSLGAIAVNNVQNVDVNAPINSNGLAIQGATGAVNINDTITSTGGTVNITANGDITAIADLTTNGGDITLRSNNRNITTQNLNSANAGGTGGNITLEALGNDQTTITTENLNSSGNAGGNVNIQSNLEINTGTITSRGTVGNGGNVTLDPENIIVSFIDAQGGPLGSGGNVDITSTGFFRATDGFIDDTGVFASISTVGGAGSGFITIRHDGGDRFEPFIVGDPAINGTAGALNTGDFIISPFRVFPGSYFFGNISIITSDRFGNALDKAVDNKIPELDPEGEPKSKGFFIDEYFTRTFERFFTGNDAAAEQSIKSLDEIRDELQEIEDATGVKPALIYGVFQPASIIAGCLHTEQVEKSEFTNVYRGENLDAENEDEFCLINPNGKEADDDVLTLITVTSEDKVQVAIVEDATRSVVRDNSILFREIFEAEKYDVSVNNNFDEDDFRASSRQFYEWLIEPLALEDDEWDNLTFILDENLRSIPLAAIGQESNDYCIAENKCLLDYVIRDYSIGLMPSMSLTETEYRRLTDFDLRIGGAESLPGQDSLPMLPTVSLEIETLTNLWENPTRSVNSKNLINEYFTIENFRQAQEDQPYGFVHLATHADFTDKEDSYIAFYPSKDNLREGDLSEDDDSWKLRIDDVRKMYWEDINFLILDACKTAVGNPDAELGFSGFAHKAQTDSVLGTLWQVRDVATNAFMARLYHGFVSGTTLEREEDVEQNADNNLTKNITKAEVLRQVQLDMLDGNIYFDQENLQAIWNNNNNETVLIKFDTVYDKDNAPLNLDLSDPFFWSAYTLVGSPW